MPTICIFDGIKIMMFYRDHFPAHFHAEFGGEEAEIGIDPIMILEGVLSRPVRAKVFEWAAIQFIKSNCARIGNWRAGTGLCCPSRRLNK